MPLVLALLTAALAALPLSSAGAQASKWLLVETQDGLTGAPEKDSRLILRAEHWAAGGATLVLACGDRLPSADRRTLLFNAAEPLHPFGSDAVVYAEVSFDGGRTQERHYWGTLQGSSAQVAFVGDSARRIGKPTAVRAVANACAGNNVAVVIPCHRRYGATAGWEGIGRACLGRWRCCAPRA